MTRLQTGAKTHEYPARLLTKNKEALERIAFEEGMSQNAVLNRAVQVLDTLRNFSGGTGTVVITFPDKDDVVVIL